MESKRALSILLAAIALTSCQSPPESADVSPVSESAPELAASDDAVVISQGSFEGAERPTSGTVKIAQSGQASQVVLDSDFNTSQGPDLKVILHRSDNLLPELAPPAFPIEEDDYVVLGVLRSFKGEQTYAIPVDVDLDAYGSVAIWCEKFNATFGAANLVAITN